MKSQNRALFGWLFFCVIIADQWTKWAAEIYLRRSIFVNKWLSFRVSHNTGCAWGWLQNSSLILAWFGVGVLFLAFLFRKKFNWSETPWFSACLLGGIFGNVLDRFVHGYVIDFIAVNLQIYRWPAFNLADAAMCIALVGMLLRRC